MPSDHGVGEKSSPPTELKIEPEPLSWEWVETFLKVAKAGSIKSAAEREGVTTATIRKRIDALEAYLGMQLFLRGSSGVRLTAYGQETLESAEQAANAIGAITRDFRRTNVATSGMVSASFPEGLGAFWISPRLRSFHDQYPNIVLDYRCVFNDHERDQDDADIIVQYNEPDRPDFKVRKLGSIHLLLYGSEEYAQRYGLPRTPAELVNHKLSYQSAAHSDGEIFLDFLKANGVTDPSGIISMRTNSSIALYQLARTGAMLSVLPTYATAFRTGLVAAPTGNIRHQRPIWLCYRNEVSNYPPARAFIDWLIASFDSKKYPWFSDDFISPEKLATYDTRPWTDNLMVETWP
ncbi:LysR family transcriptional regulator [Parvularcula marina]|uniref:LysR family transcriptional regulator n=1 Tax=Parvularcula marina TaxID=2292771 RepID=A0A371RFN4_9PROT|nr:LysR family transcriptional regulator [Parvularcula marina]RFB04253.1 LysR family transcriptional regulator [Parvularcula marina]